MVPSEYSKMRVYMPGCSMQTSEPCSNSVSAGKHTFT
jgi:hypothetical protein